MTVPYVPMSHPFMEKLIGTVRRELLDHTPFWTSTDLPQTSPHPGAAPGPRLGNELAAQPSPRRS